MHTFHHEDHSMAMYPFIIIVIVVLAILVCFFAIIYSIVKCIHKSLRYRYRFISSPVVVTQTTIPGPIPSTGYPAQQPITNLGYPMPQPQPGFAAQPYPHQPINSLPMPQPPAVDHNPPSYDQVMRGGEAYQKQAPYNPNFAGPQ